MTFTKMFKLFVIRYRLMTAEEFYNSDWLTIQLMIDSVDEIDRDEFERMRFIAYATVQCQSTKKLSPTDIIEFPWDSEKRPERNPTTKEDMDRIKAVWEERMKKKAQGPRQLS